MRISRPALLLFLCSLIPVSLSAQQSVPVATTSGPQTPQAASILQQSLAALTGGAPVTDVTMTGAVTVTAGTNTQSGTITLVATASGQSRVTFDLSAGSWTTNANYSADPRSSTTSASSGVTNDPSEDLLGPHPAWFYPAFIMGATLQTNQSSSSYTTFEFGQELYNGLTAEHLGIWPQAGAAFARTSTNTWLTMPSPGATSYLGQQDLYLDPSSLYPVALEFRSVGKAVPGTKTAINHRTVYISEEVRFANYRMVQGRPVAFHIQRYLGNILLYDIQLSSVEFNSGAVVAQAN